MSNLYSVNDTISHLKGLVSKVDSIPKSSEHLQALSEELHSIADEFTSISIGEEYCHGTCSVNVVLSTETMVTGYVNVKFDDAIFLTCYIFHGTATTLKEFEHSDVICKRCSALSKSQTWWKADSMRIGDYYYYGFEFKNPSAVSC